MISNAHEVLGSWSTLNGVSNKIGRKVRILYLLVGYVASSSARVLYSSDVRYMGAMQSSLES